MVLPMAVGKTSYNHPYLVSCFDRGKQNILTGIITSMTISRGVGNLNYTKDNRPIGVDVTITITDLSKVMAMPISTGDLFSNNVLIDNDHLFSNYMNVITSKSLYSQFYKLPKARINLTKEWFRIRDNFSASGLGLSAGEQASKFISFFLPDAGIIGAP
jgi:hypothetical protein